MKIGHVMPQTAHGCLSFSDLVSGGRGVTGSEQCLLYLAQQQASAGHQVVCYFPTSNPGFVGGVEVLDFEAYWPRLRRLDYCDVVISHLTADPLRELNPRILRILNVEINDWLLNGLGYDQFVDVYVAVSKSHQGWLSREAGNPGPNASWEILPNGVDLARFKGSPQRIPRRCVYLSSPDRGLHWALAMWPEIRFAYPDAEFHIFYEVQQWIDKAILLNSEVGIRARYVVKRIEALKRHGVVLRGALPPAQLAQELLQADVMLYPCAPVRPTEGFSLATMEGCAAGVIPVITDADALGEIYGESGACVIARSPGREWTDAYAEKVLWLLGNREEIERRRSLVRAFAQAYSWERVAGLWESMIEQHLREK